MIVFGTDEGSFSDRFKDDYKAQKTRIGVLGGIGPEATKEFYERFINKIQDEDPIEENSDFPQIIINSIPAPELTQKDLSEKQLQPYIQGLKELDDFGVDFIVMVCNTIHLFHERLQREIDTEIMDLREKVEEVIKNKNMGSVSILGTPQTLKRGLYDFKEVKTFLPNEKEREKLVKAIKEFNIGNEKETQANKAKEISEKYLSKGANTVVLGCTEFALMMKDTKVPKIDTIEVLVNSAVQKSLKSK